MKSQEVRKPNRHTHLIITEPKTSSLQWSFKVCRVLKRPVPVWVSSQQNHKSFPPTSKLNTAIRSQTIVLQFEQDTEAVYMRTRFGKAAMILLWRSHSTKPQTFETCQGGAFVLRMPLLSHVVNCETVWTPKICVTLWLMSFTDFLHVSTLA